MSGFPISPVGGADLLQALAGTAGVGGPAASASASAIAGGNPVAGSSFSQILLDGVGKVDEAVASADAQVKAFVLDDSIPLHQVTFALEEARLSLELMLQVRGRLVESYQQIMQMQL